MLPACVAGALGIGILLIIIALLLARLAV